MNKYLKQAIIMITLATLMAGCTTKQVEPIVEISDSISVEETETETQTEDDKISEADLEIIINEYESTKEKSFQDLKLFMDENIGKVPKENASEMVMLLISKSKDELQSSNNYIYGVKYAEIDQVIRNAYDFNQELFERPDSFFGDDKLTLIDKMEEGNIKDGVVKYLDWGLGIYSGEGSFYFGVDYAGFYNSYVDYVTDEIRDYLGIMAREYSDFMTVEEYLAVSVEELGLRAVSFETFLRSYPNSETYEDVRNLLMVSIWKLVNPTPFDGLATEEFKVNKELMSVYQDLVLKDECPVVQQSVKGIMAFIDTREDGVLGSWEDMDALYKQSRILHNQAAKKIEDLYK